MTALPSLNARMTSGGATPAIEMMLHIISSRHGAGFAARVAGLFLYDGPAAPTRPQSRLGGHKHNALTAKANALMEAALDEPLTLSKIADRLATSPRSLQQQFRLRLNTTPQDHYLHLRLAEARRLVCDTDLSLMEVALATGFTSPSSFARAFRVAPWHLRAGTAPNPEQAGTGQFWHVKSIPPRNAPPDHTLIGCRAATGSRPPGGPAQRDLPVTWIIW